MGKYPFMSKSTSVSLALALKRLNLKDKQPIHHRWSI
ncbi:MAG: hypothetical protein ACI9PZ_001515 [Parvicella sp.]|jgi:hypothetical protein